MSYKQFSAMLAVAKGSFKAILRSPATMAFSVGFPLIFILGFRFIDKDRGVQIPVGYNASDTSLAIFSTLKNTPGVHFFIKDTAALRTDLHRDRIRAIVYVDAKGVVKISAPEFTNMADIQVLRALLQNTLTKYSTAENYTEVVSTETDIISGKQYKTIDFFLPGMLGFALLGTGIFSVAFLFFNLRQEMVLKRFFATPISKANILLGETLSQSVFQLLSAAILIYAGVWLYDFTLANGFWSFAQIMVVCYLALIVFMGFGFVVSGLSNSSGAVPALANIFAIPQFLLAGAFYPIEKFPDWLQPFSKILPLTHFNEAVRSIGFDGASLIDCWWNIAVLLLWSMLILLLSARFFRWE